jgi:succinate dehydrogenase/fumarate reductase flavoprotein subunit
MNSITATGRGLLAAGSLIVAWHGAALAQSSSVDGAAADGAAAGATAARTAQVAVDAREAARGIMSAHLSLRVPEMAAGPA